jgi:hypothetical protein
VKIATILRVSIIVVASISAGAAFAGENKTAAEALGPEGTIWLNDQRCWCTGRYILDGPHRGKVRVSVDAEGRPIKWSDPPGDPYGFIALLNRYRSQAGLGPVAYDADLSAWASQNNAAQCGRGLGHHVNPGCRQNSGWNYADAFAVAQGWMTSPGHRAAMLAYEITRVGIAYGPGPYWTMNAR